VATSAPGHTEPSTDDVYALATQLSPGERRRLVEKIAHDLAPVPDVSSTPPPFPFEQIRRLAAEGHPRKALDLVFGGLDQLLQQGDFAACDAVLGAVSLDGLDPMVALGFLVITQRAASALPGRAALVARLREWLPAQVGPGRAEELLRRHG
jgi:hypothetical protein